MDITFPLSSNPTEFAYAGNARLVNCYAEPLGDTAKSQWALSAISGLTLLTTLDTEGGFRALLTVDSNKAIAVIGRMVVSVDATGGMTIIGGMPSDGPVAMAANSDGEVAAVCDGLYFAYQSGSWGQIEDPELPPPVSVCSLGGYFFFQTADGRLFASELNDFDVIGLSYADTEQSPDKGVVCWTRGDDLLAGGTASIEVWAVTGDDPFPARKVGMILAPETQQTIGVLAADSAIDGFFVASDGTVRLLNGYSAVIISPPQLNRLIAADAHPTLISATRWSERGKTFYAWSGTNWTWVFDATTKKWHERESYGMGRWRVSKVCQIGRTLLAGNYASGALYSMSHDVSSEDGAAIIMSASSVPIADGGRRLRHNAVFLDIVPGTAPVGATDTSVMLDWSDNGQPWGTQLTRSLGAAAQVNKQVRFNNLGSSRNRTYRVSASAALRRMALGGRVDIETMGMV